MYDSMLQDSLSISAYTPSTILLGVWCCSLTRQMLDGGAYPFPCCKILQHGPWASIGYVVRYGADECTQAL